MYTGYTGYSCAYPSGWGLYEPAAQRSLFLSLRFAPTDFLRFGLHLRFPEISKHSKYPVNLEKKKYLVIEI